MYDPLERRAAKTVNGATTQFVYDGLNPVQELDGASPPNQTANLLTNTFHRTDPVDSSLTYSTDILQGAVVRKDSTSVKRRKPRGCTREDRSVRSPYSLA